MIDCTICLDSKENYKTLRCGHQFCNDCINQLIEHNTFENCPICRTSIIPENNQSNSNQQPRLVNNFFNNRVIPITYEENLIQEIYNQIDENTRRNVQRNQQTSNCDLTRDQEFYCSMIVSFIGLICVFIIVFIEVGIIE